MDVAALVREFSGRVSLPVDVNDILACLKGNGVEADFEFIGVDLDPDILQGTYKEFYIRRGVYAEPEKMVNIYYHRGHSIDWQRFICAKELVHVLDHPSARTARSEDIDRLADKIGLPPEMQNPGKDGLDANVDRLAEWRALALLFPMAARDNLLAAYKVGKLTFADVARIADIPSRYIGLAMSEGWPPLHDLLSSEGLSPQVGA